MVPRRAARARPGEQRSRPPVTASRTSHCPSHSTRSSHCRCRMPQPTHIIKSGDAAHRYIRTHGAKCKKKRNEPNFGWSTHKTAQSCTTATANYRASPKKWGHRPCANGGIAPTPHTLPVNPNCLSYIIKRSEEHTSELQSLRHLVCRLLL